MNQLGNLRVQITKSCTQMIKNMTLAVRQKLYQIKILDSNSLTTREMDNRDALKNLMISTIRAKEAHKESTDLKYGPLCFFLK